MPTHGLHTYIPIDPNMLKVGTMLPCDLFLCLPLNNRFIRFGKESDVISADFLSDVSKKAKNGLFIRETEANKFLEYENRILSAMKTGEAIAPELETKTEIPSVDAPTPRLATTPVVPTATPVPNPAPPSKLSTPSPSASRSVLTLLPHTGQTAVYVAIMAPLIVGENDGRARELLRACLLRDAGLTQIPRSIATTIEQQQNDSERQKYRTHVELSLGILQSSGTKLSQTEERLIRQHHEKFDGTGYPNGLQGFKIDDRAQILAIADLIEALMSGRFDGKTRELPGALAWIADFEGQTSFPRYFHPEIRKKTLHRLATVDSALLEGSARLVAEVWDKIARS